MADRERETAEAALGLGGLGGLVAMLAGAPRVAGGLYLAGGLVALANGKRLMGSAYSVAGLIVFALPELKQAASREPKKELGERSTPPIYTIGLFDEEIGGGWTLLDAREQRDPKLDPDRTAHVGMVASLLLQNRGAEPRVFNAKILQISGDDYAGQWVGGAPAGGPQMIDFRGAQIFALHG